MGLAAAEVMMAKEYCSVAHVGPLHVADDMRENGE
jgi:hypothetical protein